MASSILQKAKAHASSTGLSSASQSVHKDSRMWATIKPGLVLGLETTEKALDGLPIPGAKGCIGVVLHFIKTADLAAENAEVLQALQRRYESLKDMLLLVYPERPTHVPDDVRKDVESFVMKLDSIAAEWKPELEKKKKKRSVISRFINAPDDSGVLTRFAKTVDQMIQDFLMKTTVHARIEAHEDAIKDREARTLQLLPRALSASYNSARTGGANVCLKDTRVSILDATKKWATNPDPNQPPIFWLNGLAGIGKSTIAHTLATELDKEGFLGASFVFLRADDQLKDARLVFPTLTFQLAQHNLPFKTKLVEILDQDPDCGSNLLDLQFEKLIFQPFSAISLSKPIVLILDALDECHTERLTSQLLRIIYHNIKRVPFLRVFITSRPEGYIRKALDLVDGSSPHQKLVLHEDIHAEEVENDIRLFLRLRLQEIWNNRGEDPSVRWPSEDDLEILVKQSGKLFVYAATAVRFIGGDDTLNLETQLTTLLGVKIGHVPLGEPYIELDGLYSQILTSVFPKNAGSYYEKRFRDVVGSIVLLERPLSLSALSSLLGEYSVKAINEALHHLHSIIIVPAELSEAPRTYHLSFPNFITNADRCKNLKTYVDPGQQAKYLFLRCLAVMENDFGPVLGDFPDAGVDRIHNPSPFLPQDANPIAPVITSVAEFDAVDKHSILSRTAEDDSDDSEDHSLPAEIRYAGNYWCRHLMNVPTGDQDVANILDHFIFRYLLVWLERRKVQILGNSGSPNIKVAGDTFDILHNAYRWGFYAGCSTQYQALLLTTAKQLFEQLFPDARVAYTFGKRPNAQDVRPRPPMPVIEQHIVDLASVTSHIAPISTNVTPGTIVEQSMFASLANSEISGGFFGIDAEEEAEEFMRLRAEAQLAELVAQQAEYAARLKAIMEQTKQSAWN